MIDILEMKIGSEKINAVVTDIALVNVLRPNNTVQQKIVLTVVDTATKLGYKVSDAWTEYKSNIIIRALWFYETPDGIYSDSTLAKAMRYYDVNVLKDFKGKTVQLLPDKRNFLTLIATNIA